MEQTYIFVKNNGSERLKLTAINHNHAAAELRKVVKDLSEWRLEEFK